ncbi:MAG: hypothetical protein QG646_3438, partial [Euryarchaeota archaeon]|nr:hypothetical protein [Euryarchaeota archaeon]
KLIKKLSDMEGFRKKLITEASEEEK